MPTVFEAGGYRFFFYSDETQEPPHVHVEHGDGTAKFWLSPVRLAEPSTMKAQELRRATELAKANEGVSLEKWNEWQERK